MKPQSFRSDADRARRRRRRAFILGAAGICGLAAIGILWVVLYSPVFHVRRVDAEGAARAKFEEVLDAIRSVALKSPAARVLGLENILAWPSLIEQKQLGLFPSFTRIAIKKNYIGRVVQIYAEARVPEGIWCFESSACWWFDKESVLFARAPDAEGGFLRTVHDYSGRALGLGIAVLSLERMARVIDIFNALETAGVVVREVRIDDLANEEVRVETGNGPRLYFSVRFPLGAVAAIVAQIFAGTGEFPPPNRLQYVDFRVENRVYYK